MEEQYFEQIVEKQNERNIAFCRIAIVIVVVLLFLPAFLLGISGFILIAIVAGAVGFGFILPRFYVEYEYLYMTGEFSVDRIYNKESRKKAGNWELTNMEVMTRADDIDSLKRLPQPQAVLDFTSGRGDEGVYVIAMKDQKHTQIRIEPNEDILKAIRQRFPRQAKY